MLGHEIKSRTLFLPLRNLKSSRKKKKKEEISTEKNNKAKSQIVWG